MLDSTIMVKTLTHQTFAVRNLNHIPTRRVSTPTPSPLLPFNVELSVLLVVQCYKTLFRGGGVCVSGTVNCFFTMPRIIDHDYMLFQTGTIVTRHESYPKLYELVSYSKIFQNGMLFQKIYQKLVRPP